MVQLQPFFAIPFGFAQLENCAQLNAELRAHFLKLEAEGAKHANPRPYTQRNSPVFESNFQLFRSKESCAKLRVRRGESDEGWGGLGKTVFFNSLHCSHF